MSHFLAKSWTLRSTSRRNLLVSVESRPDFHLLTGSIGFFCSGCSRSLGVQLSYLLSQFCFWHFVYPFYKQEQFFLLLLLLLNANIKALIAQKLVFKYAGLVNSVASSMGCQINYSSTFSFSVPNLLFITHPFHRFHWALYKPCL
jgi:hypothetical protein